MTASPSTDGGTFSASSVDKEGGGAVPVVPPKEAESGVDYYLNIQAIQNLMGLVYVSLWGETESYDRKLT